MAALSDYSRLDRLVHQIAFSFPNVQLSASEIEDSLFGKDLGRVDMGPPIFITSLPRAGTTILLTALNAAPELATHLYRDMPFVLAPLLWSRLSGGFRKQAAPRERAHKDGIEIGYDSPEAFEEVIWRTFWPEKYGPEGIALWSSGDAKAEGRDFMLRHFRKIVSLRCGGARRIGRYLSKNNGNIARLDLIPGLFPDSDILVPLRKPLAHAASLHRQHLAFLQRHREDPFARRYMEDIGHYEFGALHRPFRFEGLDGLTRGLEPTDLDYWLAYWVAAFEHVAGRLDRVRLLGYEDICRRGEAVGGELCELLGLDRASAPEIGRAFRPAPEVPPEVAAHRSKTRDRAEALYARLVPAML
ncbi:MAG: sulfotransferase [Kiloniellales bacterium]|nr:sulfotransferase [Kiloniellales bacterium]